MPRMPYGRGHCPLIPGRHDAPQPRCIALRFVLLLLIPILIWAAAAPGGCGHREGRSCQTAIYVHLANIITKKEGAMTIMVMVLTARSCEPRGANSSKA